jgi:hypothetical protein
LYNTTTHPPTWHGTVTSASTFGAKVDRLLRLHVSPASGEVFHVSVLANPVPNPAGKKIKVKKGDKKAAEAAKAAKRAEWRDGRTEVEVVGNVEGPAPVLNRPVVLSEDGTVEGKEEEKSFLQK